METSTQKVLLENFWATLVANIDNERMSDASFREFVRNTAPIVETSTASQKNTSSNQGKESILKKIDIIEESVKGLFSVAKKSIG